MSDNGKEKSSTRRKSMSPVDPMRLLSEHVHAAFKMLEVLMYNDAIDDGEITWRLNSLAGTLMIADIEIGTEIHMMEDEDVPEMSHALEDN